MRVITLLAAFLGLVAGAARAEKENPLQFVEHGGWSRNVRLANGEAEVLATTDVGPRVISYRLRDGKNVLKEYADQLGKAGEPDWQIRGGHRLWLAPEDTTRTYAPDNGPIQAAAGDGPGTVILTQADSKYGIEKQIELRLAPKGSRLSVIHRIKNTGSQPTELAPWALTVMAPGGIEIIPLPAKKPHPGSPDNARSPADFAPNQQLVLWPFFDFKDPRYHFGSRWITLRQDAGRGATKIGLAHREGWVGYLNGGTLFVKRFDYQDGKTCPDRGCNFETFTNEDMLEVETLGPLVRLAPGETATHTETWELIPGLSDVSSEEDIDRVVLPRVAR